MTWAATALLSGAVIASAQGGEVKPPPVPAVAQAESEKPDAGLPAGLEPGWYATIDTTLGTIVARLLPDQAPQSVAHFAALAEGRLPWVDAFTGETRTGRYYDGIKVHLVESGQRFEAGDRTETGRGAPPFYVPPEGVGPISFDRPGRFGMTRTFVGKVSGVQFFVTAIGTPWLRGRHPCFGEVVAGLDVVRAITMVKAGPGSKPVEPVVLNRIRIHRVGDVPPIPDPVPYHPKRRPFELKEPTDK